MFGRTPKMDEMLFQLKFTQKQLDRMAKKAEKDSNLQKSKVKTALQKGNVEGAKIYAENAIRKKNEALNYLRFSSKVDAVSSRVQTAAAMQNISKSMGNVVKSLDAAVKSMDLERVSKVMDKFENVFENLDVHTSVMEGSMSQATTLQAPEDQIMSLMKQVAEENNLEITEQMPSAVSTQVGGERTRVEEDQLTRRLQALRE